MSEDDLNRVARMNVALWGGDEARAERLREALKDGGGRTAVAERINVHPQSLYRYVSGRDLPTTTLIAIADACGVSVEWLATGRGPKHAEYVTSRFTGTEQRGTLLADGSAVASASIPLVTDPPIGAEARQYVAVPRYNIQAAAGAGALVEHAQVVEYLAFDLDFVRNHLRRDPKHLVLIEARGDSMEPTIRDGDILTIDITPGQPLHNAQLYVLRVGDNLLVKRLEQRLDGGLVVHSDNTRYAPELIPRDQLNTLNILGEVLLVSAPPR